MTIKTTITDDGKTIIERYGDDRPEPIIKTRMAEIEEQTGIELDRDLIGIARYAGNSERPTEAPL